MPLQLHDLQFEPFILCGQISARVKEIGEEIEQNYEGKRPIFLVVLTGAYVFAADLVRCFSGDCEVAFVKLSSYSGAISSGNVRTELPPTIELKDRHVIITEDIIDTGTTLHYFTQEIRRQNPASVAVASLLLKPDALRYQVPTDYIGFRVPTDFIVGYGLDYNGLGRNLPDLYRTLSRQ